MVMMMDMGELEDCGWRGAEENGYLNGRISNIGMATSMATKGDFDYTESCYSSGFSESKNISGSSSSSSSIISSSGSSKFEDPLRDSIVRTSLQRVQLTGTELIEMSVKELNKRLSSCPSYVVSKLKRCRRTLKNRGYAKNCRIKRIAAKNHLEKQNDKLMVEILELRQRNKLLLDQLNRLRYDHLPSTPPSSAPAIISTKPFGPGNFQHHQDNNNCICSCGHQQGLHLTGCAIGLQQEEQPHSHHHQALAYPSASDSYDYFAGAAEFVFP